MSYSVGQVAVFAGITVRTLHHYDEIALLSPSCTPEIHRGLGDLYVSDKRFRDFYDSMRPGLAEHVRAAIHANADRVG
ncbi:TipAS antibiotic-recognition domain-containing protein [Streptomyces niveus]|uniref:MerR family transcriptional regulator n=1 Tax=Streptomyces niveus TaxID=193462 RepID=UPI00367DB236